MASADAQKNGLTAFEAYEDPAYCWLDLVASFKAGNPKQVKACLEIAKASKWSHDQWQLAMELACEEDEDPEWIPPDCIGCSPEDKTYNYGARPGNSPPPDALTEHQYDLMHRSKLLAKDQQRVDDFFEE